MREEFSIEKYLTNELILKNTLAQIEKDFEFAGLQLKFSDLNEITFDKIAEKLKPEISSLLHKNYQGFLNLLYRIDLNETRLKREAEENKNKEFELIIAELIIKRELQKVVIKEFYKNK